MAQLPRPAGHAPPRTLPARFPSLFPFLGSRETLRCGRPAVAVSPPHLAASHTATQPRRLRAMSTLFAFLHHLAAFTLVAALAVEFVLIRQELTLASARKLPLVDAVLGGSATLLLIIGLLRVFYFEKGSAYYFSSHAFLMKFAVFIIVAILSIVPTMEFLS